MVEDSEEERPGIADSRLRTNMLCYRLNLSKGSFQNLLRLMSLVFLFVDKAFIEVMRVK